MFAKQSRLVFSLLFSCYLVGCSGNSDKKEIAAASNKDPITPVSTPINQSDMQFEENTLDTALVNNSKQIIGTWSVLETPEELTITVSKDSIFYVEHGELHKYELKKDSIFIHYPDYTMTGKPLLLKDTFAIVAEDQVSKFSRVKN